MSEMDYFVFLPQQCFYLPTEEITSWMKMSIPVQASSSCLHYDTWYLQYVLTYCWRIQPSTVRTTLSALDTDKKWVMHLRSSLLTFNNK